MSLPRSPPITTTFRTLNSVTPARITSSMFKTTAETRLLYSANTAHFYRYMHLYNNYLNGVSSYGHYARGSTSMLMENVYFEGVAEPVVRDDTASLAVSGNIYVDCTGDIAESSGDVFSASDFYEYTLDATEDVPSIVEAEVGPQASICE